MGNRQGKGEGDAGNGCRDERRRCERRRRSEDDQVFRKDGQKRTISGLDESKKREKTPEAEREKENSKETKQSAEMIAFVVNAQPLILSPLHPSIFPLVKMF